MKERPIVFSALMVRAILNGRKTQTRRIVKPQPKHRAIQSSKDGKWYDADCIHPGIEMKCPYGIPGDQLWVKETFFVRAAGRCCVYRASLDPTEAAGIGAMYGGWKPSIFMPRKLSRITLEITGVRVERLWDISQEDAMAEGQPDISEESPYCAKEWYSRLWESINGKDSWAKNPWVWVIGFKRI